MLKNLHFTNTLNLEILSGSYTGVNSQWFCKERSFPFTRLYYIYSGSAVLSCNGQEITMMPGNMYLLPANLPIAYRCPNKMKLFFLHITINTADGFDMLSRIPKICQIPCSESFLTQLKDFSNLEDYGHMLRFKALVSQSVTDCLLPENISFPVKTYSHEVLQAISYMQNNLTIQLTGEQIAQAIFISPSRLYKRFRAETGLPIGTYLDKMILHQAMVLLADQKLTLKEISQQLGFCDQYYFSRRFKAQMDITPSHYRKLYLAQTT